MGVSSRAGSHLGPTTLLCLGLLLVAESQGTASQEPTITGAFAAYVSGEVDAARRSLSVLLDGPARLVSSKRDFDRLIRNSKPIQGAAFALEAASVAIIENLHHGDRFAQVAILDLLESACRKLRTTPGIPRDFEHDWYRGVMALLSGPGSSLLGGVERPVWFWHGAVWLHEHSLNAHSRNRFPADGEIAFDWALSRELEVHTYLHSAGVSIMKPGVTIPLQEKQQHQFLREAAEGFEQARQNPVLQLDAMLRLGRIRRLQGKTPEALQLWDRVGEASDPRMKYLALLFRGNVFGDAGRWPEAATEFQRALAILPEAPSARLALAALDYLANQHDRASRHAKVLLDSTSVSQDPWLLYLAPGIEDWPRRLLGVRARAVLGGAP